MPDDRATRVLDEFAAVTAAAPRPDPAARRAAMRSGLPVATLAGAVLIVAAVAVGGMLIGRPAPLDEAAASSSPSVRASAGPSSPVAVATTRPSTNACGLVARIARWEGAAGQRIATVELRNTGDLECRMERLPRVQLVDGAASVLIDSGPSPSDGIATLAPGASVTSLVAVGNWCGAVPQAPISLRFVFSSGEWLLAAPVSPTDVTLPPCNGPSLPASISMRPWGAS